MRRYVLLLSFLSTAAHAAEQLETKQNKLAHATELEEVVVTAPFQKAAADTALPLGVLSEEALRKQVANSLGETLQNQLGVHSASFGPGVGQPVIRGQSGKRVQVLQNSVPVSDASNVSPDHDNGIETLLAERIEIVRGPATLLFGSGAIGGVVNVIDQRIPTRLYDRPDLIVEQSYNSVSGEDKTLFGATGSLGDFSFHADYYDRRNDEVEVHGMAIDEEALEQLEAFHEHEEDEHEEEPIVNTRGYIANSDGDGKGGTLGASWILDRGFVGVSVNKIESNYGLPGGTHAHHEHEEDEAETEEEEGQDFVRLALEQTRYDVKSHLGFDNFWFRDVDINLGYTDYEHREIEIEADGTKAIGTLFKNRGYEGRVSVTHDLYENPNSGSRWEGVWGLQFSDTDFSATGDEAFIPATNIQSVAIFGVERLSYDRLTAEFGLRFEQNDLDPDGSCSNQASANSASASVIYDLTSDMNLVVSIAHSERNPTVEELYSNIDGANCLALPDALKVTHAATSLIEVGNPDLDTERSNNLELGLRKHAGRGTLEFSAYHNQISDYIFLDLTGAEIDETDVARYVAKDATFTGFEAAYEYPLLETSKGNMDIRLSADLVRATFDDGGDVPRIPPARVGLGVNWYNADWTVDFNLSNVLQQDNVGDRELATDGYTQVTVYADRHWQLANDGEFVVFARLNNLLDEEIRNHVSFLKNFAPEAGRGIRVGLRYRY